MRAISSYQWIGYEMLPSIFRLWTVEGNIMKAKPFPQKASMLLAFGLVVAGSAAGAVTMRPVLQDSDVQKIVAAAKVAIAAEHTKGCIAVDDADGEILFLQREEGAPASCLSSAIAKARTAAKFGTSTETYHKALGPAQMVLLAVPELAPLPGGEPLFSNKELIGSVGVSTPDGNIDLKVVKEAAAALN
ncbi:heme-binding protein [Thioclava sp. BHET1]|nr:heme-binding protein [Thioclava sp. BHET1]